MRVMKAFCLAALTFITLGRTGRLEAQAFDCVLLNDDNTNIFVTPDDCFNNPDNVEWCNCVRSLFTHPVKGEASGFSIASQAITDQPGTGNSRSEVLGGTLDVSGLQVGDVIGHSEINELIPTSVGVPPGTFFVVRSEVRITAAGATSVDFDVVVVEVSFAAGLILRYSPLDAAHSNGIFYRGRLTSLGPGNGFVLEYRYPSELVGAGTSPAISVGDTADPGFTVRTRYEFISTASGIYTLPTTNTVDITTTLRRFHENNLEEILPLGEEDLCRILDGDNADPFPCKVIDETLQLKNTIDENSPPTAKIVLVDSVTAAQILPPAELQMMCGAAPVIFRGGNSDDGDGGIQTLAYMWSLDSGPEGGAVIPPETQMFKDTEIAFTIPGDYVVRLTVDDGGAANNTDTVDVEIRVFDDFNENSPPIASIVTTPDPPEVEIADGKATVTLDASGSQNGSLGFDDCMQTLTFTWRQTSGPVASNIVTPDGATTDVEFTEAGDYVIEVEVNDGQAADNLAFEEVTISVTGGVVVPVFRRGDSDSNGKLELTDAVKILTFLFSGGTAPGCLDAGDADDNGELQLTDAVRILGYLFLGGVAPLPPGPDVCGPDPTTDDPLGCDSYAPPAAFACQ